MAGGRFHLTPPTTERLLEVVERMAGRSLLVVGDLVADRFVSGIPKRISREAPVLILRYIGEELRPGGGANAVANVAALDGVPLVVGVVGTDETGRQLVEELSKRRVEIDGIASRPDFRTPTKTRILAGGRHAIKQQVVRLDVEDALPSDVGARRTIGERIETRSGAATIAVLSDYGYGTVSPELVAICRDAVGADGIILCDSRYRLPDFRGLDGATPNEEEAEAILGRPLGETLPAVAASVAELRERLDVRFLLVTRGSHGMSLADDRGCTHLPIHGSDEVADVTGAGDTVIGTFALALAAGGDALEAACLANYAGGVVVMKSGTATLTRDELRRATASDPDPLEELTWIPS